MPKITTVWLVDFGREKTKSEKTRLPEPYDLKSDPLPIELYGGWLGDRLVIALAKYIIMRSLTFIWSSLACITRPDSHNSASCPSVDSNQHPMLRVCEGSCSSESVQLSTWTSSGWCYTNLLGLRNAIARPQPPTIYLFPGSPTSLLDELNANLANWENHAAEWDAVKKNKANNTRSESYS